MSTRYPDAHVMAEGYFSEAWRLLGEGLGPFVFKRTGDQALSGTRDVYDILRKMVSSGTWERHFTELGHSERNWAWELYRGRNDSWAHQGTYSDDDIHHYVGVMLRLLRAIEANEQADEIGKLHVAIGRLIYGQPSNTNAGNPNQIILSLPEGMGGDDLADILRRTIPIVSSEESTTPDEGAVTPSDSDRDELDEPADLDGYIRRGRRYFEGKQLRRCNCNSYSRD